MKRFIDNIEFNTDSEQMIIAVLEEQKLNLDLNVAIVYSVYIFLFTLHMIMLKGI